MKRFAFLVSRVFEPEVLMSILILDWIVVLRPPFIVGSSWVLGVLVVIGFTFWSLKTGRISDIELSKKSERIPVLTVSFAVALGILLITYSFGAALLVRYTALLIIWLLLFGIITKFWKISGHTSVATLVFSFIYQVHGGYTLGLFSLILLIAWARVYQKNHTVSQVCAGIALSFTVAGIFLLY